jgi:CRISPR-associated protein (TIGR03986 family)
MNKNYREDNGKAVQTDRFVNPYNFVSLQKNCNKTIDALANLKSKTDKYSGTISVTLETLTPLFIPNTTTSAAFPFSNTVTDNRGNPKTTSGNAYDFFSYEDISQVADCTNHFAKPIIPGSSIRGAVRTAYEAATNSCLSTCDDEDLIFHRRTTTPKSCYGILAKTASGYAIFRADKVMLNTASYHGKTHSYGKSITRIANTISLGGIDKKTGDTVYVQLTSDKFKTSRGYTTKLFGVQDISITQRNGYQRGILFLGEKFQRKHHDAVFIKRGLPLNITDDDYTRFFKVWEQYQADSTGSYPNYIDLPEIPVYYSNVGNTVYIAPACISKEVFDAKYAVLLGEHKPCGTAKEKVCQACALFGLVSDEAGGALASRVMFRDALPIGFSYDTVADFYEDPRQLPILGTPRISATEFYTKDYRRTYKVWNYDYGIKKGDAVISERFSPKLRGRKFYWHKKSLTPFDENDRADLTAKIRAVKAGKRFRFEIAFDKLAEAELDSLLWVLTFGDKNQTHAHKLGHGKPIGYGSVRYTVDNVAIYALQDDLTFQTNAYHVGGYDASFVDAVPADYLKLTDFLNSPDNISYPQATRRSDSNIYRWFGLNKGNMNRPEFQQVLATPSEIMPKSASLVPNSAS